MPRGGHLRTSIPAVIIALQPAMERGAHGGAERIAATARLLAPVESGRLKASIKVIPAPHEANAYSVIADVWYAQFPEFGTVHAGAQPFLRPAFEIHRKDVVGAMGLAVREACDQPKTFIRR